MSTVPKAILYHSPESVWSAVVLLTLEEKGYASDEVDLKVVDLGRGENLDPAFLRINPKATVPTLVVPLEKTLSQEVESRYKAITSTKDIVEFLDRSRSTRSRTHTTSTAPAPSLTPATISFSAKSNLVIDTLLHGDAGDPNRLTMFSIRDEDSLKKLASTYGSKVVGRQEALGKYLQKAESGELVVSEKVKTLWREKKAGTDILVDVYAKADIPITDLPVEDQVKRQKYLQGSSDMWQVGLKEVLTQLEKEIIGPYVLGDQVSLADLHLAGWLGRVLWVVQARAEDDGKTAVNKLRKAAGLEELGECKLAAFWDAVKERASWKKVYGAGLY
ncbi:hypothetical protein BDN72DRAFT_953597 [Pluteus cervinus]|uniref:Uncharacterized protein n=1 Tax=Pluteus cervinus TaxID=181527 RepID=A0ACD3BJ01_9AGAR|nr:hypothetical protein BDN72DRAFT_953597 [Pluteus cervinus]